MSKPTRRDFFRNTTLAVGGLMLHRSPVVSTDLPASGHDLIDHAQRIAANPLNRSALQLDLAPAKWIWFPGKRTLANSVFFFRKEIHLRDKPVKADGWVIGDSRYKLYLNGSRIQFGPAPYDPRWAEADFVDLSEGLASGVNRIGAEVLFYGTGDGTMPIGKPGFIFLLNVSYADGSKEQFFSDETWQTAVASSWKPGGYKRWYLRSFQEIFDARLYPYGWANVTTSTTPIKPQISPLWLSAALLDIPASKPSLDSPKPDYLFDMQGSGAGEIRARSIPMCREYPIAVSRLTESYWVSWKTAPEDYFDFNIPDACLKGGDLSVKEDRLSTDDKTTSWSFTFSEASQHGNIASADSTQPTRSAVLTFEFTEQIVGFPFFTITAPAGTIVELLVQEGHETGADLLMNSHFNSWSRFVCREGVNTFETFDFESLRHLQLHIRETRGDIRIEHVGVRRRIYDWRHKPRIRVSDPVVNKVLQACINTLYNSAIETCVDGMGRERQQYSGDVGHQLHAIQLVLGEPQLHARFCNTFSQGSTLQGYFMDCWPAYDRMARLFERQLDLSPWGPLLDHSIGFFFDCFYYYQYTGDINSIREVFPRLIKCMHYLLSLRQKDGLLPVENVGIHWIWMDSDSYPRQGYKQCAFNLYMVAMLRHAFAPLARAFGEESLAILGEKEAASLLDATQKKFWSHTRRTFVDNPGESIPHYNERALSLAILYDLCPNNDVTASAKLMTELPKELGRSYPANVSWNFWAYAKLYRGDLILKDIRERWHAMVSVHKNNTTSESWQVRPDSNGQWSHCAVAPLFCFYMNIAGIQPRTAGWEEIEIRPQLCDLEHVELTIPTVKGDILFHSQGLPGSRTLTVQLPAGTTAWLLLDERESPQKHRLTDTQPFTIKLKYS